MHILFAYHVSLSPYTYTYIYIYIYIYNTYIYVHMNSSIGWVPQPPRDAVVDAGESSEGQVVEAGD